jgi:hypothetical protein
LSVWWVIFSSLERAICFFGIGIFNENFGRQAKFKIHDSNSVDQGRKQWYGGVDEELSSG